MASGKPASEIKEGEPVSDRFRLKIPFTSLSMTWQVIFNYLYPNCPPDFEFNDLDFNYFVSDNIEELVPSLSHWDCRNDKALINVVTELRSAYLKYQVNKLETIDNHCAYEYASLINDKRVPLDQIEVFIDGNAIIFLVKLEVNLPMVSDSPDDYTVALALKYGAMVTARRCNIHCSANIAEALGTGIDHFRGIHSEESLADYVEEVARSVEEQALTVVMNREKKRRMFLLEMLKRLGTSVVSYDSVEYQSASFLLETEGFVCILEVMLSLHFPSQPPQYRLLSVYSTTPEGPLSQTLNKIPYSESWQIHNIVEQALNVIKYKKIPGFQTVSVQRFQIPQ